MTGRNPTLVFYFLYNRYTTQPPHHLARVGAMHMSRLANTLECLFAPDARLYAPPGLGISGERLDCEWTVEAFRRGLEEAQANAVES